MTKAYEFRFFIEPLVRSTDFCGSDETTKYRQYWQLIAASEDRQKLTNPASDRNVAVSSVVKITEQKPLTGSCCDICAPRQQRNSAALTIVINHVQEGHNITPTVPSISASESSCCYRSIDLLPGRHTRRPAARRPADQTLDMGRISPWVGLGWVGRSVGRWTLKLEVAQRGASFGLVASLVVRRIFVVCRLRNSPMAANPQSPRTEASRERERKKRYTASEWKPDKAQHDPQVNIALQLDAAPNHIIYLCDEKAAQYQMQSLDA